MLRGAFEARILSRKDPRVLDLLKRIKEGKAAQVQAQEAAVAPPAHSEEAPPEEKTVVAFAASVPEPIRNSVPEPVQVPAAEATKPAISATVVSRAEAEPEPTLIAPATTVEIPIREEALFRLDEPPAAKAPAAPKAPSLLEKSLLAVRRYPIPFAAGSLVLVIAIVAAGWAISNQPTKQDLAIRAEAVRLEQQKNWPAARSAYETLGRSNRGLASFGRENAARLRKLLDQEASLLAAALGRESAGDLAAAKRDYEQLAGLHGDYEQDALNAVSRLETPVTPPPHTDSKETRRKASKSVPSTNSKTQVANEAPKTSSEPCQIAAGDISIRLDRADKYRGDGHYSDAERIYKGVLACQSNNERALSGLVKTKRGQQTDKATPPSN